MMNLTVIQGHQALIQNDLEIELLHGEFLDLNDSADFYAENLKDLKQEGKIIKSIF